MKINPYFTDFHAISSGRPDLCFFSCGKSHSKVNTYLVMIFFFKSLQKNSNMMNLTLVRVDEHSEYNSMLLRIFLQKSSWCNKVK